MNGHGPRISTTNAAVRKADPDPPAPFRALFPPGTRPDDRPLPPR
ncbi:hypothetical protein [Actinomadura chokoriensis]|uniref:Uncharacterized protein n=1 Tax=Actinomadura chokoriensis TaxID=454156 RepID=A0ABV4QWA9_9ACTN